VLQLLIDLLILLWIFFEHVTPDSNLTIQHLFSSYDFQKIGSHPEWREDLYSRALDKIKLTDFFGSHATSIHLTESGYPLSSTTIDEKSTTTIKSSPVKTVSTQMELIKTETSPKLFQVDFLIGSLAFVVLLVALSTINK